MKKVFKFLLIFLFTFSFSQENQILERLSALDNNGKLWYNVDGYSITKEDFNNTYDDKGLKKILKKHQILDSDIKTKDENLENNNVFVSKQVKIIEGNYQTNNYYFIENKNKKITVIWFVKNGKTDRETEEELIKLILNDKIPADNFVPMKLGSINFAGRNIQLGSNCYWTFLNTLQCPYKGEMNWSLHKTLEDAIETIENQFKLTKSRKGAKIVYDEIVDLEFEGVSTKAKKVVLNFSGVTSALAGLSGGKSLTVYYVAENVRGKNVSCAMSFWNNDDINPETKLPPLLEIFIKLK